MPVFQFKCDCCGDTIDITSQHYSVPTAPTCVRCSRELRQIISPSFLQWRTSLGDTIGFETRRKFTQPHKSFDAPKGTFFSIPDNPKVGGG